MLPHVSVSCLYFVHICKEAALLRVQLCAHLPERHHFVQPSFLLTFGIVHLTLSDPVSDTTQLLSLLDT